MVGWGHIFMLKDEEISIYSGRIKNGMHKLGALKKNGEIKIIIP